MRSWDSSSSSDSVLDFGRGDATLQAQLQDLRRWALPVLAVASEEFELEVRVRIWGEISSDTKFELEQLLTDYDFLRVFTTVHEESQHEFLTPPEMRDQPAAFLNIGPTTLVSRRYFQTLSGCLVNRGEQKQLVFDRLLKGKCAGNAITNVRVSNTPSAYSPVVILCHLGNDSPFSFAYKTLGSASYYAPVTHFSMFPVLFELEQTIDVDRRSDWVPMRSEELHRIVPDLMPMVTAKRSEQLVSVPFHLEDVAKFETHMAGPFELRMDFSLGDGARPKCALVSFGLEMAKGDKIPSGLEIPDLAVSGNPEIGYFFYILSTTAGINHFSYLVSLPDDIVCSEVRIFRWADKDCAISIESLKVTSC